MVRKYERRVKMLGRTFKAEVGRRKRIDAAPFVVEIEVFGTWMEAFWEGLEYCINHGMRVYRIARWKKASVGIVYSF